MFRAWLSYLSQIFPRAFQAAAGRSLRAALRESAHEARAAVFRTDVKKQLEHEQPRVVHRLELAEKSGPIDDARARHEMLAPVRAANIIEVEVKQLGAE